MHAHNAGIKLDPALVAATLDRRSTAEIPQHFPWVHKPAVTQNDHQVQKDQKEKDSLDQAQRSSSRMKTLKRVTADMTQGASRLLFAADRTLVQASYMKPSQREGL